MAASPDLFLGGITHRARVLPVVYFSILDHHIRRNAGENRVVGALLGRVTGTTVEITNSFPLLHSTDKAEAKSEGLDADQRDHLLRMIEMHKRVNPREAVVGWYATGGKVSEESVKIHDYFMTKHAQDCVHFLVDTTPGKDRVAVSALMSSSMGAPGRTTGKLFTPIECQVLLPEPERVALGLLDRGLTQQSNTVSLVSDLNHVSEATHNLHAMIGKALDYVNKVVDGQQHGDPEVGRSLRDTISAVPKIDPAKFHAMFNNSVQDLLMLMYLSNLTQSQVALQDKINEVL